MIFWCGAAIASSFHTFCRNQARTLSKRRIAFAFARLHRWTCPGLIALSCPSSRESKRLRAPGIGTRAFLSCTEFVQLFLAFSFFLVVAALLLMGLLFQFGLEQRATEVGTLLALGFAPKQVRQLLLVEGAGLSLLGGFVGVLGGLGYAKAMLWGL